MEVIICSYSKDMSDTQWPHTVTASPFSGWQRAIFGLWVNEEKFIHSSHNTHVQYSQLLRCQNDERRWLSFRVSILPGINLNTSSTIFLHASLITNMTNMITWINHQKKTNITLMNYKQDWGQMTCEERRTKTKRTKLDTSAQWMFEHGRCNSSEI